MVTATVLRCSPQCFVSYLPVYPYAGIVRRQSAVWRLMSFLDSREQLSPQGVGKSVPRREDACLLMGRGRYANDFRLRGQAYAYILRSPHAHARITRIDVAEAVHIGLVGGQMDFVRAANRAAEGDRSSRCNRPIANAPVRA